MTDSPIFRRHRQTKIVATVGPASSAPDQLRRLMLAGVDVFRLNFSHGTQANHGEVLARIRALEVEFDRPIGVIADLQGPKLRIGTFADGAVTLRTGRVIRFDLDPAPGNEERVCLPHPEVISAMGVGSTLLLDDGKVRVRVIERGADFLLGEIVAGTRLSNNKGFNVPDVTLPLSPLTAKDRADMEYALGQGVEWIALSFVQRPEDVVEARGLIGDRAAIMLKIEKPAAIQHLDELIELADALMVARGDLGVEMPAEDVPSLQKNMIQRARDAGKPVIVATQMLESMIVSPTPTRAEVSDVATAVYDGTDAVMLSAETAAGAYPVEAVAIMDKIVARVERDPMYRSIMDTHHPGLGKTTADAITHSANQAARAVDAKAIVTYTESGSTTLRAARERPPMPILAISIHEETSRRLSLSYGVHTVHVSKGISSFGEMVPEAIRIALAHGIAGMGDELAITAGVPFGRSGSTNTLRIVHLEPEPQ
ncbi:pyruvate kinase [Skermanella stibiiresistens SB22]|uniref:Pyruvate kinase n=1 Tax=Skermanella stibiiresistens SB22 TaxID=1385369 RepID=W9H2P8_9PROT|nr:pyruvate kinase [Skermanella stibiiresistens]EWY38987.1 pyruvate kinase [Skermanella stibiiresistens SB22]